MNRPVQRTVAAVAATAGILVLVVGMVRVVQHEPMVLLQSDYFGSGLSLAGGVEGEFTRLELHVELPERRVGRGTIRLTTERIALNAFGDPIETGPVRVLPVTLHRLEKRFQPIRRQGEAFEAPRAFAVRFPHAAGENSFLLVVDPRVDMKHRFVIREGSEVIWLHERGSERWLDVSEEDAAPRGSQAQIPQPPLRLKTQENYLVRTPLVASARTDDTPREHQFGTVELEVKRWDEVVLKHDRNQRTFTTLGEPALITARADPILVGSLVRRDEEDPNGPGRVRFDFVNRRRYDTGWTYSVIVSPAPGESHRLLVHRDGVVDAVLQLRPLDS